MRTTFVWTITSCMWVCLVGAGCEMKPGPITVKGNVVKVVQVNAQDAEEVDAVTALKKAQVSYDYRLTALRSYYEGVGNVDKYNEAEKELKNLREAQWFRWEGGPEVFAPQGETLDKAKADERVLVEAVVAAREAYKAALNDLYRLYYRKADSFKGSVVQRVIDRFDFVATYDYFPQAEVPGPDLRPTEVIPQADDLFAKAEKLYNEGKILPGLPDYAKERQALRMLLDLVRRYPSSTKIAASAYIIGEIYKEFFNENLRAVKWYERVWQWQPTITKPARFQAAVIYDLRLQEKDKAADLYLEVVNHEQFNQSNVNFAYHRLKVLRPEIQLKLEEPKRVKPPTQ